MQYTNIGENKSPDTKLPAFGEKYYEKWKRGKWGFITIGKRDQIITK